MSITSRSQSSSPDILGPPGDVDYLISSPIKPFAGRQSWLSPATVKRQQTPAKRPRVSLSPGKSAHSIRFDDILLPGSPTMKLNGRQRSLSPEKVQQEGNVSPWRIRVTLEATQDEENQVSPSRKRRRPSTITTKIPLKDERSPLMEKTPAKRRGRPRKSDTQAQNGSPWPGSPGNTPGQMGTTPAKRGRGRPRKGTPKPNTQEISVVEDEPTPVAEEPMSHFSPMDLTADVGVGQGRQWSPINLAIDEGGLDSDSLGADDLPVANLRAPTPARPETWETNTTHEYGRTSYDTPVIGATEHHFQDNDENIHSTPSKMPSPTRERLGSSARSSRDSGSARSQRTYPTPTPTSSLAEEENQTREAHSRRFRTTDGQDPLIEPLADPNDEHEEFDSIMESEGFTMVSLDTLPSAKQYGLGSSAKVTTDGSSKGRENGRIGDRLKRQLPGTINDLRSDSRQSSAKPSPVAQKPSFALQNDSNAQLQPEIANKQSPAHISFPELPAAPSPQEPLPEEDGDVEVEALETEDAPFGDHDAYSDQMENEEWDDREEVHFIDRSPQLAQENPAQLNSLRAQREEEWQIEREAISRQARDPTNSQKVVLIDSDDAVRDEGLQLNDEFHDQSASDVESAAEVVPSDTEPFDEEPLEEQRYDDKPFEEMPTDEEFIDELPADLKSNLGLEPRSIRTQAGHEELEMLDEHDDNESVDIWREEPQYAEPEAVREVLLPDAQDLEKEPEERVLDDEDGFDIWQQEARDHSYLSQHSDPQAHAPLQESISPWKRIASLSAKGDNLSSSPAYVNMEHGDYLETTHIRKLRDEEVDLSAVLAEEDTPNRARYYNGTNTPRGILSYRSSAASPSINGTAMKSGSTRKEVKRVRLQPISQSSPEIRPEAQFHSPAIAHKPSSQEAVVEEAEDIESVSDMAHQTEFPPTHSAAATPELPRHSDGGAPASTWFQKITSLTPRWLKAPAGHQDDSSSVTSESGVETDQDDQEDQEELASVESARDIHQVLEHAPSDRSSESPLKFLEESASPPQLKGSHSFHLAKGSGEEPDDVHFAGRSDFRDIVEDEAPQAVEDYIPEYDSVGDDLVVDVDTGDNIAVDLVDTNYGGNPTKSRPLAAFGYFSDEHYKALRRIYQMAKRFPERFSYHDAPGRAEIIGDWIWTSDGHHGVPITEVQFAIIDRFVHDLSRADIQYGGRGQVKWSEADLHRRLISIIIGEQIREERKAKSARGVSVDTWR